MSYLIKVNELLKAQKVNNLIIHLRIYNFILEDLDIFARKNVSPNLSRQDRRHSVMIVAVRQKESINFNLIVSKLLSSLNVFFLV